MERGTAEESMVADAGRDARVRGQDWLKAGFHVVQSCLIVQFIMTSEKGWRHELTHGDAVSTLPRLAIGVLLFVVLMEIGRRRKVRYFLGSPKVDWIFLVLIAGLVFGLCVAALRNS